MVSQSVRLGVDFGTTRIVVAFVDRGNYPVVSFDGPDGSARQWFPPVVAVKDLRRVYGWAAWAAQEEPGWTILRSPKRTLSAASPQTPVRIASQTVPMGELLWELCLALRFSLLECSNLPSVEASSFDVMLGMPPNASGNQRFLLSQAFQQAGFRVLGLLHEPSAASIEFAHRDPSSRQMKAKRSVLVYDLGGGAFDASLVEFDENEHRLIASESIGVLGGDDFDEILAGLALDSAGINPGERATLSQAEVFHLHEECRSQKESLGPHARQIAIDLGVVREGWPPVSLPVADFYARCQPLVQETLHATEGLLAAQGYGPPASSDAAMAGEQNLEVLYVTGGGSELPIVARMLREAFGRRVRPCAYSRFATAIGLAIEADAQAPRAEEVR